IAMFVQLSQLTGQLKVMIENSYYSVSESARVMALADQANRAESAELIDTAGVSRWQQDFDNDTSLIELRICGQPQCLNSAFTTNGIDQIKQPVYEAAVDISGPNSIKIQNVVPLVANVTFAGEASTLEKARRALLDYLKIDGQTRALIR